MLDDKEKRQVLRSLSKGMTMTYLSSGFKVVPIITYSKEARDVLAMNVCPIPSDPGYYTMGDKYIYSLIKTIDSMVSYHLESIYYEIPNNLLVEDSYGKEKITTVICYVVSNQKLNYGWINVTNIDGNES